MQLRLYEKWPNLSKIVYAFAEPINPIDKLEIFKNTNEITAGNKRFFRSFPHQSFAR